MSSHTFRTGAVIAVLVQDNRASRIAVKLARQLACRPEDRLHIVSAVLDADRRIFAKEMLAVVSQPSSLHPTEGATKNITLTVIVKEEGQSMVEALQDHLMTLSPHLVIVASERLCVRAGKGAAPSAAATSFSLLLARALRWVPLLVVKGNTCGAFNHAARPATAGSGGGGGGGGFDAHHGGGADTHRSGSEDHHHGGFVPGALKFLLEVQPSSRGMVDWVMELLSGPTGVPRPNHSLALAATRAYDHLMNVKPLAARMLTTFFCQARVNGFRASRHLLHDAATKSLPPAVEDQAIDVLVMQSPRSRALSPAIVDLLWDARTNVLLFPAADMRCAPDAHPATS